MPIATLTSKKQITVPSELVHLWHLDKGDGLLFVLQDNTVKVLPIKRKSLLGMRGSVKAKRAFKSMEELRRITREERALRYVHPESYR